MHIHTEGPLPHLAPEAAGTFRDYSFFTGANARGAVNKGLADFVPCFLSDIPGFFRRGIRPVDVALISVSPPDAHGYCSLGPSVDVTRAALQAAKARLWYQLFIMPFFSCIITEWRKAVPVSQGMKLAFSTGSQPQ